jgi:acyl carrier protein
MSPIPEIRTFIVDNFLYGKDDDFGDDVSFLEKGIIDSTGVLELVSFVEDSLASRSRTKSLFQKTSIPSAIWHLIFQRK